MPTRKYHHKSTAGCAECKLARVKCDEGKPECARCARQGRSCSYLRLATAASSPAGSAGGSTASGSSADAIPLATYLEDLELMHHYGGQAWHSLAQQSSISKIWESEVVNQAMKQPFLLRAILSFSALHLASTLVSAEQTAKRMKWLVRSHQDYTQCVVMARLEMQNINGQNCHAALLCSHLVAVLKFAQPQVTGDYGAGGVLEYMFQTIHLLRGKAAITNSAQRAITSGPLAQAMAPPPTPVAQEVPPAIRIVIEALEAKAAASFGMDPRRQSYMHAISWLRKFFVCPPGDASAARVSATWPCIIDDAFVHELHEHEPLALAILAYYATMLDDQREYWWMGNTGERLLAAIAAALGPEWRPLLEPAIERIATEIEHWADPPGLEPLRGGSEGTGSVTFENSPHAGSSSAESAGPTPESSAS